MKRKLLSQALLLIIILSFTFVSNANGRFNAAGNENVSRINNNYFACTPTTSTTNLTIFTNNLPYTWNGTVFNAAGSKTVHLTNKGGCDSAATLNLTVVSATSKTMIIQQLNNVCNNGTIIVPILVKNFKAILAFTTSVKWDYSVLKYTGFSSTIGTSVGTLADTALGELGFYWSGSNLQGTDFADSSVACS